MGLFKKKDAEKPAQKEGDGQPIVSKEAVKERKKEIAEEEKKENKGKEKPADLAYVSLRHVDKVYDNGVQAVFDFTLDIKRHEFIVFVGPSGCGKSTTLRMIAGLEDITNGELYIDGEYSNDRSPKDRDIAMVFQSYALYPHMTVYNNMAFGLKIRHLPKAEIDKRVHDAAKILQIEEFLDRKPKALSGGQRQRVALGRAIVRNAKVFLMDEPLSNLDAKLRVQMRSEIIKLHEALNATTIYVTHDQTEAMTMATRIVVMKLGHIQQIGSPIEIYNHPANVFVAGFIGSPAMNLMKATYDNGTIVLSDGKKIKCDADVVKANKDFYDAIL
jgi:multiple sugar transport system ATP-binding protein